MNDKLKLMLPEEKTELAGWNSPNGKVATYITPNEKGFNQCRLACAETIKKRVEEVVRVEVVAKVLNETKYLVNMSDKTWEEFQAQAIVTKLKAELIGENPKEQPND